MSGTNAFCGGHVHLDTGVAMVAGGHELEPPENDPGNGLNDFNWITPYDDITPPTFLRGDSLFDMSFERWYPTLTFMHDRRIIVIGGSNVIEHGGDNDDELVWIAEPEIYDPYSSAQDKWSTLQLANDPAIKTGYYPFIFVLPDGRLFMAGPELIGPTAPFYEQSSMFLDLSATNPAWTASAQSSFKGGSATMYAPGKVFKSGGPESQSQNSKKAAYIDATATTPVWVSAPDLEFARDEHNQTPLPDGKILITGGTGVRNRGDYAVLAAELYDPANNFSRRTLASMQYKRTYHSTAQPMRDGKVLVGGGEWTRDNNGVDVYDDENHNAEIFTPPYLQTGTARPVINETHTPSEVTIKTWFNIYTPQAASIKKISWIRLGAVTHGFDQDTRYVPGPAYPFITGNDPAKGAYIRIQAPTTPKVAPYGWYMLFIMTEVSTSWGTEYVPSIAKYVRIDPPEIGIEPEFGSLFGPVVSTTLRLWSETITG